MNLTNFIDPYRYPIIAALTVTLFFVLAAAWRLISSRIASKERQIDEIEDMLAKLNDKTAILNLNQDVLHERVDNQIGETKAMFINHQNEIDRRLSSYERNMLNLINKQTQYFERLISLVENRNGRDNKNLKSD